MNWKIKTIANGFLAIIVTLLLAACASRPQSVEPSGTVWGTGAFGSNGERIYFTATSENGTEISYTGGPSSNGWMMGGGGHMACASCHGPDGRGGTHVMHMQVMDAPDIRYEALNSEAGEQENNQDGIEHIQSEYGLDAFRQAVVEGKHPDGEELSANMPRWEMSDEDLTALLEYLRPLP